MKTTCVWLCFLLLFIQKKAFACKGCVTIDEKSFAKLVPRFQATLVKFDIAYPYGEKHDKFVAFAGEHSDHTDLLIAEVGVKEYGDKENEEFAKQQGIDVKKLPAIKLYLGKTGESFQFRDEISSEALHRFIMDHTDLHLVLPGCVEAYDKLAMKFANGEQKEALQQAEDLQQDKEDVTGKIYVKYMKKIMENKEFVHNERARLNKIIKGGKLAAKKKEDLTKHLNVLYSFRDTTKDEL
ncbi:PREDICTED: protein windbeutel [Nicrophorus vespilloides]|uniref:Protein windbeutel n=1 Tax=Nicrophorus vespilloides TaxID=110193 RepID=A0ABM1MRR5_NICVS|nr:PREDICTED: protein windbeutel [Nicrophorus vespilloides]